jgi:transposase
VPEPGETPTQPTTPGVIEIEFASGARMRFAGPVEAPTVKAMIAVLAKAKRR